MTFADEIEAEAGGAENIEAAVIGAFGWGGHGEGRIVRPAPVRRGVVLAWAEARPMLDYEYSSGYGAPECDAITVWTTDSVLFVVQYDGSTGIESVPRNPTAYEPGMPGG